MDSNARTPGWMVGLLVIFSLASAATFGLFLYRHAEKGALREQQVQLNYELKELRGHEGYMAGLVPPLDTQIASRRVVRGSLTSDDTQAMADIDRMVKENHADVKLIEEAVNKQIKTYQDILKEARDRRVELATEEIRASELERDQNERRTIARGKIETISFEIEAVKRKGRSDNVVFDKQIVELEDRVRQLIQQRDLTNRELRSDGQILRSVAADGYVILNIGQRQNLRKGTRFSVYNIRAGRVVEKGSIEVINVENMQSTARVLKEIDANNPLLENDHIANPVYDPNKVKGFAIRGDFTLYSKDELRRFVIESGGRYDEELTVNTDFLIAGERSEEAVRQAANIGISILNENQLIESQLLRLPDGQKQ